MKNEELWKGLALGTAAGLIGTVVIQGSMMATRKWRPDLLPPTKEEPGKFMVEKVESTLPDRTATRIPEGLEKISAKLLAFGYGATFGLLYGALDQKRKGIVLDGALLGIATWAVGYLGWLPAAGLMPPVWKQRAKKVLPNIGSHLVYGMTTTGIYSAVRNRI